MKKIILLLIPLLLLLSGCGEEPEDPTPTYTAPTLPSFDETRSPQQQLTDAVSALETARSYRVSFGTGEDLQTQTVTPPMDDALRTKLKALIPNEDFLAELSRQNITFSPSNTGSFKVVLSGLSGEAFTALTGVATDSESCSVTLVIAAEGYLSLLRLDMDDDNANVIRFDQVTYE